MGGGRLAQRFRRLGASFWFAPAVMCLVAVVLAEVLVVLDTGGAVELGPLDAFVYRAGVDGSRSVLSAVAGSMLAVAGTTFSITIAVLALASSTYGPRLVRGFMADRGNQVSLGAFVATFLYALLVLRTVRSEDGAEPAFVPHLAVNAAVLLAVVAVGVLVWFIHHISDSIQVPTLAGRVQGELERAVEHCYPGGVGDDAPSGAAWPAGAARAVVVAPDGGVVLSVALERLLDAARGCDGLVRLHVAPGSHVVRGEALAEVGAPSGEALDHLDAAVRRAVVLGAVRTPHQDLRFAVQQLLEMAVRALSPSTNDPYTAANALDDLAGGLVRLAQRGVPSPERACDGVVRLVAPRPSLEELLGAVADAVRTYALDHPSVVERGVVLLRRVATAGGGETAAVAEELRDDVLRSFRATSPEPRDARRVEAAWPAAGEDDEDG